MRLIVQTPTALVLDVDGVRRLRAADATGEFGVRPGHGDFLTLLESSVLDYTAGGATRYVAISGGVLVVEGGARVHVLAPEAACGDDLHALETTVLAAMKDRARAERAAAGGLNRLEVALAQRLEAFLGGSRRAPPGATHVRPAREAPE